MSESRIPGKTDPLAGVRDRAKQLEAWLSDNAPYCPADQRHLDEASPERAYWHYGYAAALRDVLKLLGD